MKKRILDRIEQFFNSEKLEFRRKALVFTFFLILSAIIWLMNALSKNYTTDFNYPVRFKNYPENKTLIGDLPDNLTLRVSAHGYTLFRNRISSRYIPIVFNVKSFTLNRLPGRDSSFFYIETKYILDYVSKQLNSEFEIISIKPDTLIFPFAQLHSKKVSIQSKAVYELDKQLIFKNKLTLIPDSIVVSGPDYIIDTLESVYTKTENFKIIQKSTEKEIDLEPIPHIKYETSAIKLIFNIEKFTEKVLDVPVTLINVPDSLILKIFPRQLSLSCQIGLSNFELLQSDMFSLQVDYNSIVPGVSRLQVVLAKSPNFVRGVNFKPKTVEYLIEK
ncbi:MAG: hypothetical protein K9H12_11035 [Bacteroidales bacterium]|nr:hypothetical protein [Bacteroidales bacterium]